jgi:tripartite-type tricarboxylate transporter receptor subunit TctC
MKTATLIAAIAAFAAALTLTQPVAAQSYPSKPVRIVVPYQPGQGTDVATRFLAEHLTRTMAHPFVVENRPGAGGNIGASEAARAPADGYTLLMGTNATHVLNQYLYPSMPFDAEASFEPVMLVSSFPMVLLTTASSPHGNVSDLLAEARAKPDTINVALPSTTARLVLELLNLQGTVNLRGIPYKGSGTSMTDLIGGQIPVAIDTVSASRTFIASGKLKALGVTSLKESALLPEIRTVAAQGVEGFQVIAWNGLYAPRGTPPAVVQKLNGELARILGQPEVRQRLLELGHEPAGGAPADLAEFARSERQKWGPLIAKAGLKAE